MRTAAIIPVYDEENTIAHILKKVKRYVDAIIVIDDGSIDKTKDILFGLKKHKWLSVISHADNEGKGHAMREGISVAIERGYDNIIFMDGDGQHDPDDIPGLIKGLRSHDLVIGDRLHSSEAMPFQRMFINRFNSFLISRLAGKDIHDVHCGFRAMTRSLARRISLQTDRYEIEVEMILKAAKSHASITNVPIKCIYGQERSKINPFIDTFRLISMLIRSFSW